MLSLDSHAGQNVRNDIVLEPGDGDTCDNINKWVLLIEIVFEILKKCRRRNKKTKSAQLAVRTSLVKKNLHWGYQQLTFG